jgi:hypothetical protein
MLRDPYKTVTGFVLLIPTSEARAVGEATFLSELYGPLHVRPFDLEEIQKTANKLRGAEAACFDALLALRRALESGDKLAESKAVERMENVYRLRQDEMPKEPNPRDRLQTGKLLSPLLGLPPDEAVKYLDGLRSGPLAAENLARLFSLEVTRAVGSQPEVFSGASRKPLNERPQIVLWWYEKLFRPALFCPDAKTALYIHTFFLAPVGALGFRICPYDGEQFFQDRPNQEYCCPAHREAHRVARFRDNKKRITGERGKNRRNHGIKKTR